MTAEPERVALIGFMAAGKSSIGPALAMRLGMAFIDLDDVVVQRDGRPIGQIFAQDGEEFFRRLETEVLEDHLEGPPLVLSTGGGIVQSAKNRRLLSAHACGVWLDVRFETVRRRLSDPTKEHGRPLLERLGWEGVRELHRLRRPLYASCASWRFDTDRDAPVRVARRIAVSIGRRRSAS